MPTTGYPAEMHHVPGEIGTESVTVEFKGVRITITERSDEMNQAKGTEAGTMLVLIDTERPETMTLSVQINDDDTWEGRV